jgi:hypothetical protein
LFESWRTVRSRTAAFPRELKPAKAPLDQTKGRNPALDCRLVDLYCHAPQGASGNPMIYFPGRGFSPRPISVRKHDRPMRHRKSSTVSKLFLVNSV